MSEETEIALPERPAQNIEGHYIVIPADRHRPHPLAINTTEALRLSLAFPLQDSWKEIGLGPYALQADFLGFRQYLYGHVTGGAEGRDLGAYMLDVKARYGRWRDELKGRGLVLSVCHNVCHDTMTLRQAGRSIGRHKDTARSLLIEGLSDYSRTNRMDRKYLR